MISTCPICDNSSHQNLLELNNCPIYQHPVSKDAVIEPPYVVDLEYKICDGCGHGFVSEFDYSILERLYRSYYFTPSGAEVGINLRKDFIKYLSSLELGNFNNLLEIGGSDGRTSFEIKDILGAENLFGFEPNDDNAVLAEQQGMKVSRSFFTAETATSIGDHFDFIFARHVIEHIPDFQDFFMGLEQISNPETLLVLETPCLDWCLNQSSMIPFHVEHLHVFSHYSLNSLAESFGWKLKSYTQTEAGNQIMCWTRSESPINHPDQIKASNYNKLALEVLRLRKNLIPDPDKKTILYGAGAGGVRLVTMLGLKTDYIVDGNRNKKGKVFFGVDSEVQYAPDLLAELVEQNKDQDYTIVIGSMFFNEIRENILTLGWRGHIVSPYS